MALWGVPILLAILTALGLGLALVGDGLWDSVSALALGAPVAVGAWFSLRRKPAQADRRKHSRLVDYVQKDDRLGIR
jgi:hypothetical protein